MAQTLSSCALVTGDNCLARNGLVSVASQRRKHGMVVAKLNLETRPSEMLFAVKGAYELNSKKTIFNVDPLPPVLSSLSGDRTHQVAGIPKIKGFAFAIFPPGGSALA
jgi:hypothetical protein